VPAYPAPPSAAAHFSAADFFRDCPWLNVPTHRKTDILVEPLYPRLGLLGGAPEAGGKVSKLAALAAARKKKEGATAEASAALNPRSEQSETPSPDPQGTPRSLRERLAASGRSTPKPAEGLGSLGRPAKPISSSPSPVQKDSTSEPREPRKPLVPQVSPPASRDIEELKEPERQQSQPSIRALPSTFASTIVGTSRPTIAEHSHLHSNSRDLLRIYGQDNAEPFDFAAPSPDDVVLNAQNAAKGLAIRRKV
jgi:elongation factor 1 alpha-like protein